MKSAFIDPVTSVLKAYGFVETNVPGDVRIPVEDDFALEPGKWKFNNGTFIPHLPPPLGKSPLQLLEERVAKLEKLA